MTVNGSTPDWLNPVPFGDVGHATVPGKPGQLPGDPQQWDVLSEDQLQQMRKQLLESVISSVVQAVGGLFVPGPFGAALDQLAEWAGNLPTFEQLFEAFTDATGLVLDQGPVEFLDSLFAGISDATGIDLADPSTIFNAISGFLTNIGVTIQQVIDEIQKAIGGILTGGVLDPAKIFDSIKTLIEGISVTLAQVVAEIERLTGLNIDQGPVAFLQSLVAAFTGQPLIQLPAANVGGVDGFANLGLGVTDALTNAVNALGGLQTTWAEWFGAFTGRPPVAEQALDQIPALTADEIKELLATTAANATALAALQATVTSNINNMVASGDDFEDNAPLSTRWTKVDTGTGGFSVVKGQAVWTDAGTAGYEKYFRIGSDAQTITEYQKVTRVTGTTVAESTLLTAGPGVDYIYGRVSGTGTTRNYIYAAFDGDGRVFLGYAVNGVETPFPHPATTAAKPTAGTTYALECGDIQSPRRYRVLRNNAPVLTYDDAANAAAAVTGKGWGWGGKAVQRFAGQSSPSGLHSVSVVDIPPTPTLGTMLLAVRDLTAAVTKPAGDRTLPPNTFNRVLRNSPDISFNQTSNIMVITKEGPYTLSARIDTGTDLTQSEEWELLLYEYVGGVPVLRRRGGQMGGPNTIFATSAGSALDCTFQFYSSGPNGQWAVGFRSTASESIVGSADGATTYLTLTRGV